MKKTIVSTFLGLSIIAAAQVHANNANMTGSTAAAPYVSHPYEQGGTAVRSGQAWYGSVIYPIPGYSRGQCNISVSGMPTKADGGYKRGRHFSLWTQAWGSGWMLRSGARQIQTNRLDYVGNTAIQYQIVCAK